MRFPPRHFVAWFLLYTYGTLAVFGQALHCLPGFHHCAWHQRARAPGQAVAHVHAHHDHAHYAGTSDHDHSPADRGYARWTQPSGNRPGNAALDSPWHGTAALVDNDGCLLCQFIASSKAPVVASAICTQAAVEEHEAVVDPLLPPLLKFEPYRARSPPAAC